MSHVQRAHGPGAGEGPHKPGDPGGGNGPQHAKNKFDQKAADAKELDRIKADVASGKISPEEGKRQGEAIMQRAHDAGES